MLGGATARVPRAFHCVCRDKVLPVLSLLPVVGPGESSAIEQPGVNCIALPLRAVRCMPAQYFFLRFHSQAHA